ncbi:tetratricopeptide repeat protein [Mucilaginibacter sp. NFX135]|uniref:tetratricopeptide repeat protein n=1 Tax=Mucilaginibacter sp. NFX135 TaxID=3402687 RepID=UPI003AFA75E5
MRMCRYADVQMCGCTNFRCADVSGNAKPATRTLLRIIYILLLIISPLLAFSDDATMALFKKGNAEYAKAQYPAAIASYQKLVDGGYRSVAIYFNLGNAYYKNGDIPSALLYYEKAHKLSPGDEDIRINIQLANLKTTDKLEATPEFFITKWWHGFILTCSLGTLAVLSVLLILGGALVLILYRFTSSVTIKKVSFYSAIALVFLGLVCIFIAGRQADYFDSHHEAIVFSGSVTIKSEPTLKSKDLFVLHDGTKVDILEHNADWVKIRLSNGNEGWISATDVREI